MARKWRPSKAQKALMDRLCGDQILCREKGEDNPFFFSNGGIRPNPRTVQALIDRGVIQPNRDGLFGESQTFTLAGPKS